MTHDIRIYADQHILAETLADDLIEIVKMHSVDDMYFTIALSGGTTPDLLFEVLNAKYNDSAYWKNVSFFWVDERCVPPDDEASNFRKAENLFFGRTGIDRNNIHRIRGENDPLSEAERYSNFLLENVKGRRGLPCLNTVLLGLGEDGHTASIFPGNENLFKSPKICEMAEHPVTKQKRITITGSVINNSELIIFLAAGKNKAEMVKRILKNEDKDKLLPASMVNPVEGRIIWYLDAAAASLL